MEWDVLVTDQALVLWGALGTVFGTLLLLAGTVWAGKLCTTQARDLWRTVRGHRADVIAAVDDSTDPVIARLAEALPIPAGVWAAFLPAFLTALADGLDHALVVSEGEGDVAE